MNKVTNIIALILMAIIHAVISAADYLKSNSSDLAIDSSENLGNSANASDGDQGAAAQEQPVTRRRGRQPAGATTAGATTAGATTAAQEQQATTQTAPAEGELTADKLREMAGELVEAGRGAEVKGLTRKYGAESIGQLDPKHYKAVANGIEALLL